MSGNTLAVPARSVFAGVLLWSLKESLKKKRESTWPTIVDLSNEIVVLKKKANLDTSGISIRSDKGGWISDDLASFVNGFVLFGLATPRPIILSDEAVGLCREVLESDSRNNPNSIQAFCDKLGIEFSPGTTA